ncbi:MAG: hypothetical protein EHM12_11300 [Dehalococcoidia bacterium]|nr:MAG: hypothetical protein EHM12_11300 [Dehalococcoidia bacterium]
MSNTKKTDAANQMILAKNLIKKDQLEMTEIEVDLYLAPQDLVEAKAEIVRLKALVIRLAKNELSEPEKAILLAN